MTRTIYVPRAYVDIVKEKEKPTAHIRDPDNGWLYGRHEKGDTQQLKEIKRRGLIVEESGRGKTWALRMNRDYSIFEKGENIGRTKDTYPRQKNTTLIRNKAGRIIKVKVRTHTRKRNNKRFPVSRHSRRIRI